MYAERKGWMGTFQICPPGLPTGWPWEAHLVIWWLSGKRIRLPMQGTQEKLVQSLSWKDPLQEEMATHSSIHAWRIPWTEEPCGEPAHKVTKSWI